MCGNLREIMPLAQKIIFVLKSIYWHLHELIGIFQSCEQLMIGENKTKQNTEWLSGVIFLQRVLSLRKSSQVW